MGAYEWLDIAIGSDTGGSIRGPSGAQGLFGNRPTHGLVDLSTNVMPLATALDTVGFLTRDPYLWDTAQQVMYSTNYTSSPGTAYPKKIQLLAGYPTNASESPSSALFVDFATNLASFLEAETVALNVTEAWTESHPSDTPSSLDDLVNTTYAVLVTKDQTRLVRDPLYADYAAANDGRTPFINPSPLARWTWGDTQPDTALAEATANKTTFMDWFNSQIMPSTDPSDAACSDSLMLYPGSTGGDGGLSPRDTYRSAPGVPFGWSDGRISVFAEVPDFVFPLGETAFYSNASSHEEMMPVAVDIMAARGCDGMLTRLARDLVEAGILTLPLPGRSLVGGETLLRREVDN
jgi:Asp-tRNA(Asn)/Glu-tRNA(Gln) amidotransferase A subunit family amidase